MCKLPSFLTIYGAHVVVCAYTCLSGRPKDVRTTPVELDGATTPPPQVRARHRGDPAWMRLPEQ
jgi:hypothetical protein